MNVLLLFLVTACSLVVLIGPALAQDDQTRNTRGRIVGKDCKPERSVQAGNGGQVAKGAAKM
jgi:hypothetical protein